MKLAIYENGGALKDTLNYIDGDGQQVDYVVQVDKSDRVERITGDAPITYLGFKKWE